MRALVLSGGGAKGAYQVGVLKKWMFEDHLDYEALCGISVGAINAAYLAQYAYGFPKQAWGKLSEIWARVDSSNVKKSWFPFGALAALWKPSVYNSEPLQQWVTRELREEDVLKSGRQLRVVSVSWNSGEAQVITEKAPGIARWVLASSSFPVMLAPIEIDGQLWTDGGLRQVTPLGEAIKLGADEIDVIMCSNPYAPSPFETHKKAALPDFAMRAIDIMSDEIMRADLKICGLKNDIAGLNGSYKTVKIRLLQPSTLICDALDFSPKHIQEMMELGYTDACRMVP
jgi:NTE family protein